MLTKEQRAFVTHFARSEHLWEDNATLNANKIAITIQLIEDAIARVRTSIASIEDCLHADMDQQSMELLKKQKAMLSKLVDPLTASIEAMSQPSMGIYSPVRKLHHNMVQS